MSGPDDGHTFEFTVRIRSSSKVTGEEHHTDAVDFGEPLEVQLVRAWSLRQALAKLMRQPLYNWFPGDYECNTCNDLGFTAQLGPVSGATIHEPCPDCPAGELESHRLP